VKCSSEGSFNSKIKEIMAKELANKKMDKKATKSAFMFMAVMIIIALFAQAAFSQSSTRVTYENNITGVTTNTFVKDHLGSIAYKYDNGSGAQYISSTYYTPQGYSSIEEVKAEFGQPTYNKPIKAEFVYINVLRIEPKTGSITEEWETLNNCTYLVNKSRTEISFTERKPDGTVVKQWKSSIIDSFEDDVVYSFVANNTVITIWKDKTMVSIEDRSDIFLITGMYHSSTNLIDYN